MSLSKQYKQYEAQARRDGKTPVSFDRYKAMADVRAQRAAKGSSKAKTDNSAVAIVQRRKGRQQAQTPTTSPRDAQIAELQRQLDALQTVEEAPQAQASNGHIEIRDPESLATGRQLWKLNELGLLGKVKGTLSKGAASAMLDAAINS